MILHPSTSILHATVLKGDFVEADALGFLDDGVFDGTELLLLRQWRALLLLPRVELMDLTLEFPPRLIAPVDHRQALHLIDDLIHQLFQRLGQIAVGLLALHAAQLLSQFSHELLHVRMFADPLRHLLGQLQHHLPSLLHQLISAGRLLLIEVVHLLLEDLIGEGGLDLLDPILGQIRLTGFGRPGHHMHMRVIPLVVKGGVPPEVLGRDFHSCRNLISMGTQQGAPRLGIVVAQACCVLPTQRDDVGPYVSGVVFQFVHGLVQVYAIFIPEQPVVPQTLSTRTSGDVFGVALGGADLGPVLFQGQGDEG